MATLYIVGTPIGNLGDITIRGIETLKSVDLILAEDTRVTKNLLEHYQIKTPVISYHQHSKLQKIDYILDLLRQGRNLALVSDAGTPGISDPGGKLIQLAAKQLGNLKIIPVPGPSALTAAASLADFPMDRFLFLGFPPSKRKRKKFFKEVTNSDYPVILYESPHRIIKTLRELRIVNKELRIMICRELTKKFETIYRGTAEEVLEQLERSEIKGEIVAIVEK